MRPRLEMPAGHGELVTRPGLSEWAGMARSNEHAAESWSFEIAGVPVLEVRELARRELMERAAETTARMGLPVRPGGEGAGPLIVTGHQPDLYHSGVWVKDFLVERVARETGGVGVDIVVDTDSFDWIGVRAPCLDPKVSRCRQYLAVGTPDSCFACTPVPAAEHIEDFCSATAAMLESLPSPAIARHFSDFCGALRRAAPLSTSIAELVTGARRHYEGDLTGYLELPVTSAATTRAFRLFALDILLSAKRFAESLNAELSEYRSIHRIRSSAQPFPDLQIASDGVELPFWVLAGRRRIPVSARDTGDGIDVRAGDHIVTLPYDAAAAERVLAESDLVLVPRAVALTLFVRTLFADLFVHGIGGDRYDRVTDALAQRWWGVELPPYVVASLTMYLPLGASVVTDEEIARIDARLHRLTHNPDEALGDVEFDSPGERRAALGLATEKERLIEEISGPDADRKALGIRIREINEMLSGLVEPLAADLHARRARLLAQQRDAEILTDRTYPFCLWSPAEVADKVL